MQSVAIATCMATHQLAGVFAACPQQGDGPSYLLHIAVSVSHRLTFRKLY